MIDTFRKKYKPISDEQKIQINLIKGIAELLEEAFNESTTSDNGREMAIAKTQLETSIMWAVKGITK
jgi:hypothetical protein